MKEIVLYVLKLSYVNMRCYWNIFHVSSESWLLPSKIHVMKYVVGNIYIHISNCSCTNQYVNDDLMVSSKKA